MIGGFSFSFQKKMLLFGRSYIQNTLFRPAQCNCPLFIVTDREQTAVLVNKRDFSLQLNGLSCQRIAVFFLFKTEDYYKLRSVSD